jgi:Organic radical activating enzymes
VFVRFAGCNLRCPFCDTEFDTYREMSAEEILTEINSLSPQTTDSRPLIVLTGGEPTLQVDEGLIDLLHQDGFEVAMESNGTRPAPANLDWLTVSPKQKPVRQHCNEVKVVFDEGSDPEELIQHLTSDSRPLLYLQPCDTGDAERNKAITQACVMYIMKHPQWRLSLQTHKLIDIK